MPKYTRKPNFGNHLSAHKKDENWSQFQFIGCQLHQTSTVFLMRWSFFIFIQCPPLLLDYSLLINQTDIPGYKSTFSSWGLRNKNLPLISFCVFRILTLTWTFCSTEESLLLNVTNLSACMIKEDKEDTVGQLAV